MAANYISSVPKLKGRENYSDWAFAAENLLVLDGLQKCIKGGSDVDAETDAKAKAKLILTIDTSLYVHIKEAKSTSELWDRLKALFDDSGFTRRINLLRMLISTRLESSDNMAAYVNQIVDTAQKLSGTGFTISDEWIGSLLLAGLPEKFSPMIMAIEHSGIDITTDSIKSKLMDMEGDVGNAGSAFISKSKFPRKHVGHHENSKNDSHQSSVKKVNVKCYECKQFGHFKSKCPNREQKETKKSNAFSVVFLNGRLFNKEDWYIDSGASLHMTANRDWLEDISEETTVSEIMVANETQIPVTCVGRVNIKTVVGTTKYNISVNDVLCVPQLATNLLSVSQLIKNGNTVQFEPDGCKIYNRHSELVATCDLIENVYKLNVESSKYCLFTASQMVTADTWHKRLGHINYKDLDTMKTAVKGIEYKENVSGRSTKNCIVCCEGKQARLPFQHKGTRAKAVLDVIHGDLCGPMEVPSLNGSRYFQIFEDDYSRMVFIYFLKYKSQVNECFKDFQRLVENQQDRKIKCFRTDNGGEFCNEELEKHLKRSGIIHQKTNPYTPEQNGMSERMNRTIVERARCLLFQAELETKLWAEAVATAVYLRNRTVASGLDKKTPYEIWTGHKPDLSNLRVFGSTAMVHTPKAKRTKFEKKSRKMILVGFGEDVKGYRLFDPENNAVITSRDVIIIEKEKEEEILVCIENKENPDSVGDRTAEVSQEYKSEECELSMDNAMSDPTNSDFVPDAQEATVETQGGATRRSTREPKPKEFVDYVTYMSSQSMTTTNPKSDPTTIKEALSGSDGEKWKQAMFEELQSFKENEAWELVDPPVQVNVVECKWVYKKKCDSDNNISFRARLVAKGFTQSPGIDFDETFSPVVRHSSLRLLIGLSVQLDLKIRHFDVKTAFLNGYLKETIYMRQPEGFITPGTEHKVCRLNKAIYGLKQSSRVWNSRVDEVLTEIGYNKSDYEPCLYVRCKNDLLTIVALYVDDFFIFSNDSCEIENLKNTLSSKFCIKDLGEAKQILGMRVCRNWSKGIISLDQESYIDQVLTKFNMSECRPVSTPMERGINLDNCSNNLDNNVPYQQLIGSLMYIAVLTRPDIMFSISFLSQFNNCHSDIHWKCAKRVLRYLKGTKSFRLEFRKSKKGLEGFADADWASNTQDRKSYTGFVFTFSGTPISWESRKQRTVALSSTEAEYMSLSEAAKEAIYLRNLLNSLTGNLKCINLYNDSQSAQKLSVNPVCHKRSKHIDVRYHFLREAVCNNHINVIYLPTTEMPADILTKPLGSDKHVKFRNLLCINEM